MRKFRAVLEKITVERMTIAIEAKDFQDAVTKARRQTEVVKVRGVTIVTPYDVNEISATEKVLSVTES